MTKIVEIARAKINLTLNVLGRRSDGFHELVSLVAFASFGDVLTLDVTGHGATNTAATVTGPFGELISDTNLADTALDRLRTHDLGLLIGHVTLQKNLPIAAGIGGGSADAAAVLRAVRTANAARGGTVDWHGIAAGLGSDVPVCLESRAAWMTGRGETVTHLEHLPSLGIVLVNALAPVPFDKTRQVFQQLNAPAIQEQSTSSPLPRAGRGKAWEVKFGSHYEDRFDSAGDLIACMAEHGNDLAVPAEQVLPAIAEVKNAIERVSGCRYAAVSGAGPTCFGIFDDPEAAVSVLRRAKPHWWIQPATLS